MILVIRDNGKALNLEQADKLDDSVSPTGPTNLVVEMGGTLYLVENYSVQELVDHCSGRFGCVQVIRRYWRPFKPQS